MSSEAFVITLVAVAISLGLAPLFLSKWVRPSVSWTLAASLFALSVWYNSVMWKAPHPFHLLLVVPFWISLFISVLWLVRNRVDAGSS